MDVFQLSQAFMLFRIIPSLPSTVIVSEVHNLTDLSVAEHHALVCGSVEKTL